VLLGRQALMRAAKAAVHPGPWQRGDLLEDRFAGALSRSCTYEHLYNDRGVLGFLGPAHEGSGCIG
jgi:hypothetical protein